MILLKCALFGLTEPSLPANDCTVYCVLLFYSIDRPYDPIVLLNTNCAEVEKLIKFIMSHNCVVSFQDGQFSPKSSQ